MAQNEHFPKDSVVEYIAARPQPSWLTWSFLDTLESELNKIYKELHCVMMPIEIVNQHTVLLNMTDSIEGVASLHLSSRISMIKC